MVVRAADSFQSIPAAFLHFARELPESQVYSQACVSSQDSSSKRTWVGRTRKESCSRVAKIAAYLRQVGIKPGDRVAIISNSRPEWMEADLAILAIGAVTVSVYHSIVAHEVGYLLFDSAATVVVAENQEQLDKLLELNAKPCPIPATEERSAGEAQISLRQVLCIERVTPHPLVAQFDEILQGPEDPFDLVDGLKRSDLATLVYTSGTTGPPKGVMQSHGNHLANVRQAVDSGVFRADATLMIFLPLAHAFAKLMGYLGFLTPAMIKFPAITNPLSSKPDPVSWARDIREGSAKIVPTVPRMLEKMKAGIEAQGVRAGVQGVVVRHTLLAASRMLRARTRGVPVSLLTRAVFLATTPVRSKIRRALFGPDFWYAISGGAKLPLEVNEFFEGLGVPVLQGYGLTETVVATNVNRPATNRLGTVGPALADDILIRIAEDGEILFKGPNVALGYYQRPSATALAWDQDGWFHTGDIGALSPDGFLSITGRKKELIVTAGGKKVAPEAIEQRVKSSPFISQAVLLGEGKPYCVMLVVLDPPMLDAWAAREGIQLGEKPHQHAAVKELVDGVVAKVNAELASFESIKKVEIIPDEFSIENGLLTPTFKVRRTVVMQRFGGLFESLY